MKKKITFIIPAAGNSRRFGKKDKIFYKLKNNITILENIIIKVFDYSKQIIIVLNKENITKAKTLIKKEKYKKKIKLIRQSKKKGTAIAIIDAIKHTKEKILAVVWADQIGLTKKTIAYSLKKINDRKIYIFVPIKQSKQCYTNVILNQKNNILEIKNTSNSKQIDKKGFNDCGFFIFYKNKISKILFRNIRNKKLLNNKLEFDFINLFKNLDTTRSKAFISKDRNDIIGINYLKDLNKI